MQNLSPGQRILGLDYGEKHTGVAISDPGLKIAFPRAMWHGMTLNQVLEAIRELIVRDQVGCIVVGWPLNLKGEPTQQTQKTQRFIEFLRNSLEVEVQKIDERWSTIQAKKSGGDDSVAAQILLQTYLDMIQSRHA